MLITWLQIFLVFGILLDLVAMYFLSRGAPGGAVFVGLIAFIVWGTFALGSFAIEYPVMVNGTTEWIAKNDPALPYIGIFGVFITAALVLGSAFELSLQEAERV